MPSIKGSGGVLCAAVSELIVGIILLSIYEAYKANYITAANNTSTGSGLTTYTANATYPNGTSNFQITYQLPSQNSPIDTGVTISTPLDFVFYLSILLNIFAVAGIFGIINAIKELVMIFFAWNAIQLIVTFSFFVDIATVAGLKYFNSKNKDSASVTRSAQAAAAFMFFAFLLSILSSFFGIKTLNDFKNKEREDALAINMANTALNNL